MPASGHGTSGRGRRPARRAAAPRPSATTGRGASGRPSGRQQARPGTGTGPGAGRSRAGAASGLRKAASARAATERRASRRLKQLLVLASIFVMLAITLVPTLRSYLHQQGQIDALREHVGTQERKVGELQKEQARWNDDAYVVQQARERLKFVKVGDRSYTVIDGEPTKPAIKGVASAPASSSDHPWYGQLWESVRAADTRSATRQPAPKPTPAK